MTKTLKEIVQEALYDMGYRTPGFFDDSFLEDLGKYALSDEPVLIIGETGTGKELIAKTIHALSTRKKKTFCPVLCPGLSAELLESELFGHKKGAFTGATQDKKGIFEEAQDGTVFLDEIADLPINLQSKVLRVLNDGTYRPVGSAKEKKTSARIICASNKELLSLPETVFRRDLYYRISVLPVRLSPLREEIKKASMNLNAFNVHIFSLFFEMENEPVNITPGAITKLAAYAWPGNHRELMNVLKRAYIKSKLNNTKGVKGKSYLSLKEKSSTVIEENSIIFDVAEEQKFMNDILLKDIIDYAEEEKSRIVEEKVRDILKSGKDIKNTLKEEGSRDSYANFRKKVERITGKKFREMIQ